MKKERRGGPRRGAGLKPGTPYKNALKSPSERRSIKKQVSYTVVEFPRVSEAMTQGGYTDFNAFGRAATIKLADEILNNGGSDVITRK